MVAVQDFQRLYFKYSLQKQLIDHKLGQRQNAQRQYRVSCGSLIMRPLDAPPTSHGHIQVANFR